MNIVSLFDGMSCGQIAIERAGINANNYFASEIDKHAIKVTMDNYPNTIQLGDITKWRDWNLPKINLLIGGSPCQGFSVAGKGLNFDDPRSKLFFEFVDVLKAVEPKYFLLENVKMKKEHQDIISEYLGVEPIEINSSLVSAQNRVRLYWTNIQGVTQPEDKGINLVDILETHNEINPGAIRGRKLNEGIRKDNSGNIPFTQCLEVKSVNSNKSNCLTTVNKDNVLTSLSAGRYPDAYNNKLPFRYYTPVEYERLQTVPDGYTSVVSDTRRKKMLGNAWTVDVIVHILKNIS